MKKTDFTILENTPLTGSVYRLRLAGDSSAVTAPGQFVNILLPGFYLRRPFSVCDWGEGELTILYKILGRGTAAMTALRPGEKLEVLTALGNGFDPSAAGDRPLLVGGGVGIPPLYGLAKRLRDQGKQPAAALGFNTVSEAILLEEFRGLGVELHVATADGSLGIPGLVTAAVEAAGAYSHLYACGPEPMLKAVYRICETDGQFSFEERMGCGFGACMGCTCATKYGPKRICRDGPVLRKEEILW